MAVNPLGAALSLSEHLDGIPDGISGKGWFLLKHSVRERDWDIRDLKRRHIELQEKFEALKSAHAESERALAVAQDRIKSGGPAALIKAIFTLLGGAVAGFGLDLYKNDATAAAGISLLAIGAGLMLVSEVHAVWQGFRRHG